VLGKFVVLVGGMIQEPPCVPFVAYLDFEEKGLKIVGDGRQRRSKGYGKRAETSSARLGAYGLEQWATQLTGLEAAEQLRKSSRPDCEIIFIHGIERVVSS